MSSSSSKQTIGLFSPSWWVPELTVRKTATFLKEQGVNVFIHPQALARSSGQTAGAPSKRVKALHELYENDDVDIILCMRGGYGALQLLDRINYKLIAKNPKPLVGFSDATALLNAIYEKTGTIGFHAPTGKHFVDHPETAGQDFQHLLSLIGDTDELFIPAKKIINEGASVGTLVGGNMTVFDQLIGTPYMPTDENIILCLEEVGEKVNELDKKLLHLKHSGFLNRVTGAVFGTLSNMSDNAMPFDQTPLRIFRKHLKKIPMVMGAPFGHISYNATLPIGAKVAFEVTRTGFSLRNTHE